MPNCLLQNVVMYQTGNAAAPHVSLPQFEYVRELLQKPSENLTTFTKSLAVEGTILDQLLESSIIKDETIPSAVREDLQSKSRIEQAKSLLRAISACREVPVAHFLFFLSVQKPGIINILEEGLLARVEDVLETNWNVLQLEEPDVSTSWSEKKIELDGEFDSLAQSMECSRPITVLCVGKTGVGKSTLANALSGKLATDPGSAQTGRGGTSVTKKVEIIECFGNNIPFTFWDTPGPTKDTEDRKTFSNIKKDIKKQGGKLDLLIFCAPAHETRDRPENGMIIENLTRELGKKIWDNAIIAFTQANVVMDPDHETTTAAYFHKHCVSEMTNRYRKFLVEKSGLSAQEAEMVPCVPLGRHAQAYLPDGTEWKKNFCMVCISRASKDIRGILASSSIFNSDQLAVPMTGIDKLRMMLGITGGSVGGAAVGIGTGIGIAVRAGIAAGAVAAAPTGPGAIIGAAVGGVGGIGISIGVYFAIRFYQRYKAKKRVKEYENLIGDHEDAHTA